MTRWNPSNPQVADRCLFSLFRGFCFCLGIIGRLVSWPPRFWFTWDCPLRETRGLNLRAYIIFAFPYPLIVCTGVIKTAQGEMMESVFGLGGRPAPCTKTVLANGQWAAVFMHPPLHCLILLPGLQWQMHTDGFTGRLYAYISSTCNWNLRNIHS